MVSDSKKEKNMKAELEKRGAYLHVGREGLGIPIPLGKKPVWITGYSTAGDFVCRLEVNSSGIAVYTGTKGKKKLRDLNWEEFIHALKKKPI
jgi:hypothetical protein